MARYRVVSHQAHIRAHLLPVKKGERQPYRGKLPQGTIIEGQEVADASAMTWIFFEHAGRPGFVWKSRVIELPDEMGAP